MNRKSETRERRYRLLKFVHEYLPSTLCASLTTVLKQNKNDHLQCAKKSVHVQCL